MIVGFISADLTSGLTLVLSNPSALHCIDSNDFTLKRLRAYLRMQLSTV